MHEITLIGAGNMGSALLKGWLDRGIIEPGEIFVCEKDPEMAAKASAGLGLTLVDDIAEAVADSRIVLLAVKPQDSGPVLEEIATTSPGSDRMLISIAAGLTISSIRAKIGPSAAVVRVMPNVAALVGAAVSAYSLDPGESAFDEEVVETLLGAIGGSVEVEEGLMNLVTAVSGSGPAYFFLMVEALQGAAVKLGMPVEAASMLARETLWSAAKVLRETGREAQDLRKAVSSPGGTTLAALSVLEERGFVESMFKAVEAANSRAGELAS